MPLHHEAHSCGPNCALKLFIYLTETKALNLTRIFLHWPSIGCDAYSVNNVETKQKLNIIKAITFQGQCFTTLYDLCSDS